MAARDAGCDFKPMHTQRRALGPHDVLIDMAYCGICHTDLHIAAGHLSSLGLKSYPCVAGHELSGTVAAVGPAVTKFKVGDGIGVGCMVDSCRTCAACLRGEEQKCSSQVQTYGSGDRNKRGLFAPGAPQHTLGGYTDRMVVDEHFGIKIPAGFPLEAAGPIMCSGVTLFDPLRRYGATVGTRVGIAGIGGLGQMGIKIARALGCQVTAITRSPAKAAFAHKCGAQATLLSGDVAAMASSRGTLDLVLNTIPAEHDYHAFTALLAPGGKQIMLGITTGEGEGT